MNSTISDRNKWVDTNAPASFIKYTCATSNTFPNPNTAFFRMCAITNGCNDYSMYVVTGSFFG